MLSSTLVCRLRMGTLQPSPQQHTGTVQAAAANLLHMDPSPNQASNSCVNNPTDLTSPERPVNSWSSSVEQTL